MNARAALLAPWLAIVVREGCGDGGLDLIEVTCRVCQASKAAAVDKGDAWFRSMTLYFEHAESCIVPRNLARAAAARWN